MESQPPDGQVLRFPSRAERWVTKRELAEHLGVSEKTIERWARAGMPRLAPAGKHTVRFRISACEQWLEGVT